MELRKRWQLIKFTYYVTEYALYVLLLANSQRDEPDVGSALSLSLFIAPTFFSQMDFVCYWSG